MKYSALLETMREKKRNAIAKINAGIKGPFGFLVEAELRKHAGFVAWHLLAKEFCETLADHIEELMADDDTAKEVGNIYMAYIDKDSGLYDLLPAEAQLFTIEGELFAMAEE